jgi:PIN domain nuclease of toxin-antitoxin system
VKLLLDTHVALWSIIDSPRLPRRIRVLIEDPANEIIVSAASIWEIGIKHALRRGGSNPLPFSAHQSMAFFLQAGYELLSVTPEHGAAVETLPLHHGDPFDRLLVAQAMTEPLRLVSHDPAIARYGDIVIGF